MTLTVSLKIFITSFPRLLRLLVAFGSSVGKATWPGLWNLAANRSILIKGCNVSRRWNLQVCWPILS